MTTTYIPGTVDHPTQEDADRASVHNMRCAKAVANVQPIRESVSAGSVVRMKSGGPSMVVIERSTNWAYVTWHKDDGNDVLKDWIPTACLELVK